MGLLTAQLLVVVPALEVGLRTLLDSIEVLATCC
jgi:hypothetical protein